MYSCFFPLHVQFQAKGSSYQDFLLGLKEIFQKHLEVFSAVYMMGRSSTATDSKACFVEDPEGWMAKENPMLWELD